jgi:hypothetical protein
MAAKNPHTPGKDLLFLINNLKTLEETFYLLLTKKTCTNLVKIPERHRVSAEEDVWTIQETKNLLRKNENSSFRLNKKIR